MDNYRKIRAMVIIDQGPVFSVVQVNFTKKKLCRYVNVQIFYLINLKKEEEPGAGKFHLFFPAVVYTFSV